MISYNSENWQSLCVHALMVTKKMILGNALIVNLMREKSYFRVNIKTLKMVFGHTVNNAMMLIMTQEMVVIIL